MNISFDSSVNDFLAQAKSKILAVIDIHAGEDVIQSGNAETFADYAVNFGSTCKWREPQAETTYAVLRVFENGKGLAGSNMAYDTVRQVQWCNAELDTGTHLDSSTPWTQSWGKILKTYLAFAFNLTSIDDVDIAFKYGHGSEYVEYVEGDPTHEGCLWAFISKPAWNMLVDVDLSLLEAREFRIFAINGPSSAKKYGAFAHARKKPIEYFFGAGLCDDTCLVSFQTLSDEWWYERGEDAHTFAASGEDFLNIYGFNWVICGLSTWGNRIGWADNFSNLTCEKNKYMDERGLQGDGKMAGWKANDQLAKHCFLQIRGDQRFLDTFDAFHLDGLTDGEDNSKYLKVAMSNTCRGYADLQNLAYLAAFGNVLAYKICRETKAKNLEEAQQYLNAGVKPTVQGSLGAAFFDGVSWSFSGTGEVGAEDSHKAMAAMPIMQMRISPWRALPGLAGHPNTEQRNLTVLEGRHDLALSWPEDEWSKTRVEYNARRGYSLDNQPAKTGWDPTFTPTQVRAYGTGLGNIQPSESYRHTVDGYRVPVVKEARKATAALPIMTNTDANTHDGNVDIYWRARKNVFTNKALEFNLTDWLGLDSDKTIQVRAQWDF